jgi:hypothetical protein
VRQKRLRSGGRLCRGGFNRNRLRRGVGASDQDPELGSLALGLFLLRRRSGLSGQLGSFGRRRLRAPFDELGVFAGEGRLKELFDRVARL